MPMAPLPPRETLPLLLGAPDATITRHTSVLPGLHTVVLEWSSGGPPHTALRSFVWQAGAVAEGAGLASLQTYLAEIRAHEREDLNADAVEVLLVATAGAPPGFSPHAIRGALRGVSGGVTARPFSVTLVQSHWTAPATHPAPQDQPSAPPSTMQPPGGPAPPLVARAVLTLDAAYRGEWAISVMMPFGQTFEPKLTVPLPPPPRTCNPPA